MCFNVGVIAIDCLYVGWLEVLAPWGVDCLHWINLWADAEIRLGCSFPVIHETVREGIHLRHRI